MRMGFVQHRRAETPQIADALAKQYQLGSDAERWGAQFNLNKRYGDYDRNTNRLFGVYDREYRSVNDANNRAMQKYVADQEAAAARSGSFMKGLTSLATPFLGPAMGTAGNMFSNYLFGE